MRLKSILQVASIISLLVLVGCVGHPNIVEETIYETNPSTNYVVVALTNGLEVTYQTNPVVHYNFKVREGVMTIVRTGETIAGTFGPQFAAIFGLIGAALAGWAGIRNRKLNATVANQVYDMQVAREIIGRVSTPEVSAGFKEHLISSQKIDGVKSVVEDAVDEQKGDTGPESEAMRILKVA